jgi:hypothetical protein
MKFIEYLESLLDVYTDENNLEEDGLVDEADAIILDYVLDGLVSADHYNLYDVIIDLSNGIYFESVEA